MQERFFRTAYEQYNLSKPFQLLVGCVGNSWVKQSFDLLELPTIFMLDCYHLYRSARPAFGYTHRKETWFKKIYKRDPERVLPEILVVAAKSSARKTDGLKAFIKCLNNNRDGLLDPDCRALLQKGLGNLGGIERKVDKLVVRRLKGHGRSWRLGGVKAMVEVCRHKEELQQGVLKTFTVSSDCCQPEKVRQKKTAYGEWLRADVPAIQIGHSARPWAKVLKEIVLPKGVI